MAQNRGGRSRSRSKEPTHIWSGFWCGLIIIIGVILWTLLRLPLMPFIWLGILVGGTTATYPTPARKTDPIDPKKLNVYYRWKDMFSGLKPYSRPEKDDEFDENPETFTDLMSKSDWLAVHRVSWWVGWFVGLYASRGCGLWTIPFNMIFGFMSVMGVIHWRDRLVDRRHIYQGVSVFAFLQKGKPSQKTTAIVSAVVLLVILGACAYLGFVDIPTTLSLPALLFLSLVTKFDKKKQTAYWRELVKAQRMLDGWVKSDDLAKMWGGAYVTQVKKVGHRKNPMHVMRVRLQDQYDAPRSNEKVLKAGVEPLRSSATSSGYNFIALLAAKTIKENGWQFDPSLVRIVYGKDESCIPDITKKKVGAKIAQLVADIAYDYCAQNEWHKRPPLVQVIDAAADDEEEAAWLMLLHNPPSGGALITQLGLEWLANPFSPADIIKMPIFSDLENAFMLAAQPETKLNDKGNKYRPAGLTQSKSFNRYIELSRRFKQDQKAWQDIVGSKLNLPVCNYDEEKIVETSEGWSISFMPEMLTAPDRTSDFMRYDLSSLDPSKDFVGLIEENGITSLVMADNAPLRIDRLTGSRPEYRRYAQALIYKALMDVMPSRAEVVIDSCQQMGKGTAIWRIGFHLGRGGTVADVRRKSANISAAVGSERVYWDWQSADRATVWLCSNPYLGTDPDSVSHWKIRAAQKELIQLALSDAWGVAGVQDSSGKTPTVESLGVLPNNKEVLLAKFQIPGGLDLDKPQYNLGKFLTEANYPYGRIIQAYGTDFSMVLAKKSPFPTSVMADWETAKKCDRRKFPIGVDDLGNPVYWDTKTTPHLLISGKSGSGKSSASQIVIAEALLKGEDIILIDPSKGCIDFTQWAKPKALAFVGLYQLRETEAVISWAREEMAERVRINNKYGVGNIFELNPDDVEEADRKHLKPLNILFDEFNSYLQETGKTTQNPQKDMQIANDNAAVSATNASIARTMSALSKIIVQGRTAGIRCIFGAQRLTMDDMKKYNGNAFFRSLGRILLGMDSPAGVVSAQNLSEANRTQKSLKNEDGLIPVGRGMYESMQGTLMAVQTWYSGGQDELAKLVADIPNPEPIDYQQYMPRAAEQFTKLDVEDIKEIFTSNNGSENVEDEDVEEEEW